MAASRNDSEKFPLTLELGPKTAPAVCVPAKGKWLGEREARACLQLKSQSISVLKSLAAVTVL